MIYYFTKTKWLNFHTFAYNSQTHTGCYVRHSYVYFIMQNAIIQLYCYWSLAWYDG